MIATTCAALTLPHHFDQLLTNIQPPQERRDAAKTLPAEVRQFLKDATNFATIAPHTRLVGSYARHTAILAIKDVDNLVFVPYTASGERPEAATVLEDLFKALKSLPEALGYEGQAIIRRRQRRSVHVAFTEHDFYLDIVPALMPDGLGQPLLVPDREWERWVESDPLGYGEALSALNAEHKDKVVPLIKLFKHWRGVQMQRRRPKSYWLEVLTYQHLNEGWVVTDGLSYAELFTDLLRSVRDRFQATLDDGERVPEIPDPQLDNNVAFNWERTAFESFMARLDESIGWAGRALAKSRDEIDDAVALWQKVFGIDHFTDTRQARMLQQADWLKAGTTFVTSTGAISSVRPTGERAIEAPRHRFYGAGS